MASMLLAINDANQKNGKIIPELATTSKNVQLELTKIIEPYASGSVQTFQSWYDGSISAPPVAVVGSWYSSRVIRISQPAHALGVSQVAWCGAPSWKDNELYATNFRIPPVDNGAVIATYRILKKKQVTDAAIVYFQGDTWGIAMMNTLVKLCNSDASFKCKISGYALPNGLTETTSELADALSSIQTRGIRTVLSAVYPESAILALMTKGSQLGIAGTGPKAVGYLWISMQGHFLDNSFAHVWHGLLRVEIPDANMPVDKTKTFFDHWKKNVPQLKVQVPVPQNPLSMEAAHSPEACKLFAGYAYESVGRIRMALERADLTLPSSPKGNNQWLGTSLRRELQIGTTMSGISYGPAERKSLAAGKPWIENNWPFSVFNYAGPGANSNLLMYESTDTGLRDGKDLAKAVLPGGESYSTAGVGQLTQTPCNRPDARVCSSVSAFGACVPVKTTGAAEGWCKCISGYIGRFCNFAEYATTPPEASADLPVQITVQVVDFEGIMKDGDMFKLSLLYTLSWNDPRVPFDAGEYLSATESDALLQSIWKPSIKVSGTISRTKSQTLRIVRDPAESDMAKKAVMLTLSRTVEVEQTFHPSFVDFPFDKHTLEVVIHAGTAEFHLVQKPAILIPSTGSSWNAQWDPNTEFGSKWARLKESSGVLTIILSVQRAYVITTFRLLLPMTVLVFTSWSAFFIKPAALMPRFASGFISFLALQGFKSYAIKLMPKEGEISDMSWIDTYISVVGFLMGLAVVETVTSQYLNEHVSPMASRYVDVAARFSFPAVYMTFFGMMATPGETHIKVIIAHAMIGAFIIIGIFYCWFEARYFPSNLVRRVVRKNTTASLRHRIYKLSDNELHQVFDALCSLNEKHRGSASSMSVNALEDDDFVEVQHVADWLIHAKSALAPYREQVEALIELTFGETEFQFPVFKQEFPGFLTKLTLLLHGDRDHVDAVKGQQIRKTQSNATNGGSRKKESREKENFIRVEAGENSEASSPDKKQQQPEEGDEEDDYDYDEEEERTMAAVSPDQQPKQASQRRPSANKGRPAHEKATAQGTVAQQMIEGLTGQEI